MLFSDRGWGRETTMSNRVLSYVLRLVDALALVALLVVANQVIPGAESYGTLPAGSTIAFSIGCVPLVYLAYVANRLFGAIGRGDTFVKENATRLKRMGAASAASAAVWVVCLVICVVMGVGDGHFSVYEVLTVALIFTVALSVICFALGLLTDRAADIKSENDMTV
jgi:hypothetical protein